MSSTDVFQHKVCKIDSYNDSNRDICYKTVVSHCRIYPLRCE